MPQDQEEMVVDPIEIEPESRETTVGNSVDCRRVLTAMNIFGDPEVLLVRDFLDAAEIQHLIDFAESGWEPSEVGQGVYRTKDEGQDLANQVSEIRTSYSCLIEPGQSEIITAIENRLAALAEGSSETWHGHQVLGAPQHGQVFAGAVFQPAS